MANPIVDKAIGDIRLPNLFPKPYVMIDQMRKRLEADQAYQAQVREERRKDNATKLTKVLEYSPDAVMTDYNSRISDRVQNEFFQEATKVYKGDRAPSTEDLTRLAGIKSSINSDINVLKSYNETLKRNYQVAKENIGGELNSQFVLEELGDSIYNEEGGLRDISELKDQDLNKIWDNPNAYNWSSIDKNISNTLADNIQEDVISEYVGGIQTIQEIETKSKFVELNPDGSVAYDENGEPKLKISPEVLSRYLKHDGAKKVIEAKQAELQEQYPNIQVSKLDALASLKKGTQIVEQKIKATRVPDKSNSGKGITEQDLNLRDQTIEAISQPFGMSGDLSEPKRESQQALQALIGNAEIAGQDILDVEVVKAGQPSDFYSNQSSDPLSMATGGKDKSTADYDRYVFKVAGGKSRGRTTEELYEVDLTKPSYWFWHGVLNTSKAENKRIPKDKQQEFNSKNYPEEGALDDL